MGDSIAWKRGGKKMTVPSDIKRRIGAFLALWFFGQLNDLEALATMLESIAAEARKQAYQGGSSTIR